MTLRLKVKKYWHSFRRNYLQSVYDSCLDLTMKQNLMKKIQFHEGKLNQI